MTTIRKTVNKAAILSAIAILASCGTKKAIVSDSKPATQTTTQKSNSANASLRFVQQVSDQRLYQKNIVGDMSFSIQAGSLNHTLPGQLRMRKNEVIRLQVMIPLLQTEIGRIEFTPDYVLVIDRLHKEYIKSEYNQLAFLKDNGLDFYSLQALFWNELLVPGKQSVKEGDFELFTADINTQGTDVPLTLTSGKLSFKWNVQRTSYKILSTMVTYLSSAHGTSNLSWTYADFKNVGVKTFPASQSFTFTTNVGGKTQNATVSLRLSSVRTDADWQALTTPSAKYKKVEASDVFDKILNMQ